MTDDEKKIAAIEKRTVYDGGYVTLVDDDYRTLLASRLAWKFTAKCLAAKDNRKPKSK